MRVESTEQNTASIEKAGKQGNNFKERWRHFYRLFRSPAIQSQESARVEKMTEKRWDISKRRLGRPRPDVCISFGTRSEGRKREDTPMHYELTYLSQSAEIGEFSDYCGTS